MSVRLFDDAQALLGFLAARPETAAPANDASSALGWDPPRLNEAAAILCKAGLATTHDPRGAQPFRFARLCLSDRGVGMASKLRSV